MALPSVTTGAIMTGDTGNFSETYANRNAGIGLTLTPTGTVNDGNGGNNYRVTFVDSTAGVINPMAITVTATANTKTYDGTTTATAIPIVTAGSIVAGDTGSFTESYASKDPGTGLTLIPTGTVNDGNRGNNYSLTFSSVNTGVIIAPATPAAATQYSTNTQYSTIIARINTLTDAMILPTSNSSELYTQPTFGFFEGRPADGAWIVWSENSKGKRQLRRRITQ